MKVTTLFGQGSSVGGVVHSSSGSHEKISKGHSNTQEMNNIGFVPIAPSSKAVIGGGNVMQVAPPAVERASSEVLYSSITPR